MQDFTPVVELFHHSFAVPIIAILHRDGGAKFVTLVNRLGASRATVTHTLAHLTRKGIVMRNPGYGHPMRPEYVLTLAGVPLGPPCVELVERVARLGVDSIAYRKWPMPVVTAIGDGVSRFGEIAEALRSITPRSLSGALRHLARMRLVQREVSNGWPPYPSYELSKEGSLLVPALDGMCRAAIRHDAV